LISKLNPHQALSRSLVLPALLALSAFAAPMALRAQDAAPAAPAPQPSAAPSAPVAPTDPFPPANLKFFTATTPSTTTVDSFLKSIWGFDPNREWRIEGIQKTDTPGVAKIVVYVTSKAPNSKMQALTFFVMPDGKHAIADTMIDFGAAPFADRAKLMREQATGPSTGPADKAFNLVEFADLQCPHCKDAQETMKKLAADFPKAHIVFQLFPLVAVHPAAFEAAADGICIAKKSNAAFFTYAQAVYDTQEALAGDGATRTLAAAIAKAGQDPAAISACAALPATKDAVNANIKLAEEAGVEQTPTLVANGRPLPLNGIPYDTLKNMIYFQAKSDGIVLDPPQPTLSTLGK